MALRVSFFCCGLVFAAGGFNLLRALDDDAAPAAAVGVHAMFMLVSFGLAIWGESRTAADLRELAEYRRQELAESPRSSRSSLN